MIKVDTNNLTKEEAKHLHALMLALKHANLTNDMVNFDKADDKWNIYTSNIVLSFDNINDACITLINVCSFDEELVLATIEYYEKILKVQFTEEQAKEYVSYYSNKEAEKVKTKSMKVDSKK